MDVQTIRDMGLPFLLLAMTSKAQAIKRLREVTNLGLRETKEALDAVLYDDQDTGRLSPIRVAAVFGIDQELARRLSAMRTGGAVSSMERALKIARAERDNLQEQAAGLRSEIYALRVAEEKPAQPGLDKIWAREMHGTIDNGEDYALPFSITLPEAKPMSKFLDLLLEE